MNAHSKIPKAYQVGHANFYGRDFLVTRDVLIPRPESEQIIDAVLDLTGKPYLPGVKPLEAKINAKNLQILDVGTGSGCLAITLALELPEATITAIDISKPALELAQKNARKLGVNPPINFIISHLLDNVKFTPDIIVANLPYVDKTWPWLDLESLSYEPSAALYAADHGLALIKELIDEASALRTKYLVLEADPCEHSSIIDYASGKNYVANSVQGFALTFSLTTN